MELTVTGCDEVDGFKKRLDSFMVEEMSSMG